MADEVKKTIIDSRYPLWQVMVQDWTLWRDTFNGGRYYRDTYLERFATREDDAEYATRKALTPIPTFAKSALLDVRNAIFQRLRDVTRKDGSSTYQQAVAGLNGGVDGRGSSMDSFLGGKNVLTELLLMGKVGIFVDSTPIPPGARQIDAVDAKPYLYAYPVEDVINFTASEPEELSEFQSVLLRDTAMTYDQATGLPEATTRRYRYMYINENRTVSVQFYDVDGNQISRDGTKGGGPIVLELTRIPFVLLDIGDGLLKDVCSHQVALLNLGSSDVYVVAKTYFPFFTRQVTGRDSINYLKPADLEGGTATSGGQGAGQRELRIGAQQGITYGKDLDRPDFVAPPAEPLTASMLLQRNLKDDIRTLVNLAVTSLSERVPANSRQFGDEGLNAGLSYIGLVLEGGERLIASYWAAYEERVAEHRKIPTIKYPDQYSLKTDADRIEEATKLTTLITKVPSPKARREIAKWTVQALLGGKVTVEVLEAIGREIDTAPYTTSDPDTIHNAVADGLCGDKTASLAMGFNKEEYLEAQRDHAERAARIVLAQRDVGARGAKDLSAMPNAGTLEKKAAQDTTLEVSTNVPVRGEGK
jgi:hypothetical protein